MVTTASGWAWPTIGSAGYVAREVVGAEDLVDFTAKEDPLERLADRLGASAATTLRPPVRRFRRYSAALT